MMISSIRVLSPDVRGKIAAGEVITRPVSVIKELIENALDAGASRIDVTIMDGGKTRCSVNDDGSGIIPGDVSRAIERYATSKIETIDDIERITTYGFRGEALASIAQISHMTVETSDSEKGARIIVHEGVIREHVESYRSKGTRVVVDDLFFNLPARRKFLRSAQREKQLIVECVREYAVIHYSVHFTITADERDVLNIPPARDLSERMKMLTTRAIYDTLRPLTIHIGGVTIKGLFSRPDFQERHMIRFLSVNKRPVKYPRLYRTIMVAYQEPKKPPAFAIDIVVPVDQVDVNIHPTKREVKLRNERYVVDILTQGLKQNILTRAPGAAIGVAPYEKGEMDRDHPASNAQFVQDAVFEFKDQHTTGVSSGEMHEFWQVHNMFIFAQTRSGLIIVDQHAAHERIIYESIMKGRSESQRLLFPITLDLNPEEYRTYRKTKTVLRDLGIDFKEFSSRTVVIDSVPTDSKVDRDDLTGLFRDIDGLGNLIKEKAEIAKVVACHTAIKAGQRMSEIEMQSLIDKLFACEHPHTCPHGRPSVIRFTMDELAARFGRT
jgi:DNA mismatch repair protein MutL